jgi:hypothetical protein
MSESWPWLALAALGAYHGLNQFDLLGAMRQMGAIPEP